MLKTGKTKVPIFLVGSALVLFIACSGDHQGEDKITLGGLAQAEPPEYNFKVTVFQPYGELGLNSGKVDINGKPARVKCLTCHQEVKPNDKYVMATKLEKFHKGIELAHGKLTCRSCHNPPFFQDFKLVTGKIVDYANVMELCTQCHGQQRNDFDRGAHGGMAGYWDLNAGPRDRNHCLECHNGHRPAIPQKTPAPFPLYRFVEDREVSHDH